MLYKMRFVTALMTVGFVITAFTSNVQALQLDKGLDVAAGTSGAGYGTTNLETMIGSLIKVILGLVGILFLLLTIYSGFTWMTARGDSKQVDTAKQTLVRAVIGLTIILAAYALTEFILRALGET